MPKPEFFSPLEEKEGKREIIEEIENIPLPPDQKMELFLAFIGEKPVSSLGILYESDKARPGEREEFIRKKNQIEQCLKKTGLYFEIEERREVEATGVERLKLDFLVAREKKAIDELKEAQEKQDYVTMGRLFGYPETAVQAFKKGMETERMEDFVIVNEKEWFETLPEEEKKPLSQEGVLDFLIFRLSKEHWREELEVLRKWQRQIQTQAPKLYREIMGRFETKRE